MTLNPYQPPSSPLDGPRLDRDAVVSERLIESLRKTRPWVAVIAVIGIVFGGLIALVSVGLLIDGDLELRALGWTYLGMALVMLGVSITLQRYARSIRMLLHGGGLAELEQAIDAQAKFWRAAGIIGAICAVLFVAMIVLVAIAGAALAHMF